MEIAELGVETEGTIVRYFKGDLRTMVKIDTIYSGMSLIKSLTQLGTITSVDSNGNCGYYAITKGIFDRGFDDGNCYNNIGLFRKMLYEFANESFIDLCGDKKEIIPSKVTDTEGNTVVISNFTRGLIQPSKRKVIFGVGFSAVYGHKVLILMRA